MSLATIHKHTAALVHWAISRPYGIGWLLCPVVAVIGLAIICLELCAVFTWNVLKLAGWIALILCAAAGGLCMAVAWLVRKSGCSLFA